MVMRTCEDHNIDHHQEGPPPPPPHTRNVLDRIMTFGMLRSPDSGHRGEGRPLFPYLGWILRRGVWCLGPDGRSFGLFLSIRGSHEHLSLWPLTSVWYPWWEGQSGGGGGRVAETGVVLSPSSMAFSLSLRMCYDVISIMEHWRQLTD